MKQEKGIILLNEVIPNFKKAMKEHKVIPNDLCGPYFNGYWLMGIEEKDWFLKILKADGLPTSFYIELLMEELARNVGIPSIESKIVKCGKNTYGLVSKSYLTLGYEIVTGEEILRNYQTKLLNEKQDFYYDDYPEEVASLEFTWEALEDYFSSYQNKKYIVLGILDELAKRYVFSFFTLNRDFHAGNWEIFVNPQHAALVPLYDMDLSFDKNFELRHNSMHATLDHEDIYEDFLEYYQSSSTDFQKELERQFSILTPEFIKISMENVLKKHDIFLDQREKEKIYIIYENHYEKIKSLLERSRGR